MSANKKISINKIKKIINGSGLFDKVYYLKMNRDVRLADMTPLEHYCKFGIFEDRKLNSDFDPIWYRKYYTDVQSNGMHPVIHYALYGRAENRFMNECEMQKYFRIQASNGFDEVFYRNSYADLQSQKEGFDYLLHYVRYGEAEGRMMAPDSTAVASNAIITQEEVVENNIVENPATEPSLPSRAAQPVAERVGNTELDLSMFDSDYYLQTYPDVAEAEVDPEWHYYANGEREGRKPNKGFCPDFYNKLNADVRRAGISPFRHYSDSGIHENRLAASPRKLREESRSADTKPLLFVGHDGIQAGSEVVLLEVIKWFYHHTNRQIRLLLLAPGPVANQYAHYADVYVLPDYSVDNGEVLKEFLSCPFEFIYLNTVVSGRLFGLINEHNIVLDGEIVTHIHEMEKVLAEHEEEMSQLLQNTKVWISASPASSATMLEKYALPSDKVVTVPAFINPVAHPEAPGNQLQAEARKALGLSDDAFVVSGCGTVYWRKGADLFIEAARSIKSQSSRKCEFVWLGDGPDKDELVGQLTEEEHKYIKFVGNRNDSNKMLAAADVFFLSSREDPFPLVVLESAQHGVPTVCFEPATGITTFLQNDAGIAVREIDANLAADAIVGLVNDKSRREALGGVAKQRLFSTYTTDKQNIKIFDAIQKHTNYQPSVSVIVPFYNHEKFINERIDSILAQRIKDIEIIALDDCSSDNTAERVTPYLDDSRIRLVQNTNNSGSPFKQWEKGIRLATADIIWIAEGDDTCDDNFLQTLLPYFDDPMVNIAAARTAIIDENGTLKENALAPYLNMAFPGKFEQNYIRDGFQEINEQLGAMCTLVNASGLLIRKSAFGPALQVAQSYKMCGDWLIYLECLKNGKIAYDVQTSNYFRRHSASQVHKIEGTDVYFAERNAITDYVLEHYHVSKRLIKKAFDAIDHEWSRFKYKHPEKVLADLYDKEQLRKKVKLFDHKPHVAFYIHGMLFSKGGIERLAAQLSNHLVREGWKVTVFCRIHNSELPVYSLYDTINLVPIFDENKLDASVAALRNELSHSSIDVFVPMLSEWLFDPIVEAAHNTGIPVIASEHNDPWKIEELWWSHKKRIDCFEKVDGIHLLLHKFAESLPESLRNKVHVIPNGVNIPEGIITDHRKNLIVSVGRLEPQKRFDRLIDAVSIIQGSLRQEGYRVEVYGEGSLRESLQEQINSLNVSDLVVLKGKTSDIESVYSKASLFVLPSEFEGFGLVLVEALSFALPSIAFSECNGPNEIIRDGMDGRLVTTVKEMADVLAEYIGEGDLTTLRTHARERAREYSIGNFYEKWKSVFMKFEQR